ncbi:M20 family metallopeptidase [Saccharopolyspora phatthalungensis]|uniref:Succinyl-diaminopimelate desuccinylase n=1 Tax=Saccharopolyspora phatthalungensis TaxID=664693 RepID=A0A840QFF8_9PSEU|nr:M20 family metallopeptidase [Saccharopolyspora phatthalungensis]MBB5159166.1 succinyl-diaminopimelate desuccinylase [Saccharopolyspora phatthalungensis]
MDTVDLAQQLVRLDTRAGGEKPAAELVASLVADAGFEVQIDEPVPGRANVIARSGTGTPITLTGHLDTVPADGSSWSWDPLSGQIEGGRLLGRGSSDMKAGVACIVTAAIRHAADRPSGVGTQLVFTFGEETGCEGGAQIDRAALRPSPVLVVAEPTANRVVLGHKGTLWLRLAVRGVAAHGSRPELGRNALAELAAAAVRIHQHTGWPVSPAQGPATVNVGTFRSGVQPNLVPDHAEMCLDVRTVAGFGSAEAIAEITALAGPEVRIERILDLPGVATGPDSPFVRNLVEIVGDARWQPEHATYFTDASVLAEKLGEPDVVLFGPGDPEQAHTVDESCSVELIEQAAEAIYQLLRRGAALC